MGVMKPIDLNQYVIVLGGIRMQGYADGDACTWDYDGPAFNYVVGGDGEGVRSRNYNRSCIVKPRLMQSSVVNTLLSALHTLDLSKPNGSGVAPFQLQDIFGTTLLTGAQAWIEAPPNGVLAPTGQPREWTIRVHELLGVHGGN